MVAGGLESLLNPAGIAVGISAVGAYIIEGPFTGFRERRKNGRKIAKLIGVSPSDINIRHVLELADEIFLDSRGYLHVQYQVPPQKPLSKELTEYYRHPSGPGSDAALRDFFGDPTVQQYFLKPKSVLDRFLFY